MIRQITRQLGLALSFLMLCCAVHTASAAGQPNKRTFFEQLLATPNPVVVGQTIQVQAQLKYIDPSNRNKAKGLANKLVTFSAGSYVIAQSTTDKDGWARMAVTPAASFLPGKTKSKNLYIKAEFTREYEYQHASLQTKVTVTK